jgi:uncharacterized protein YbaP (TraB family)
VRRLATAAPLALSWIAVACATRPTAPTGPPPPPAAFYWEARSPEGTPLFLLGSVHVGLAGRELALPPPVARDWARADELVVEVDLTSMPDLERLEVVARHGMLPPDRNLRDVVSEDTWHLLLPWLRARGQPLAMVSRMRPWLVAQHVAQLELAAAGADPARGVDAWFLRRAADEEKPVAPLESLEEQLALFGALPAPVEEALLRDVLAETGTVRETLRAILRAWELGDEARLLELLLPDRSDPRLAAFHQVAFVARNHRMAARLAAWSADGRARFAVIGTGHLIGPDAVPALLAAHGFRVERRPDAFVQSFDPAALPPASPAAHP